MKWLVAPQEFKGALTAAQAASAIAEGIRAEDPDAVIDLCPLADGGPGTVAAALSTEGANEQTTVARDPIGRSVLARWAELPGGRAVLEMAAASGLSLLHRDERAPLHTTTYGTGELILSARARGCREVVLGVGGSATTDGGAGALQALGVRLLDARGEELEPGGAALASLHSIDVSGCWFAGELQVATDVQNPLLGPTGSAAVYGPQKGATAEDVSVLQDALAHFADVVKRTTGRDVSMVAGTGAAGGLAFGLHALLGATLRSGFEAVSDLVGLPARVARADVVVTGEGRFDSQTAYGKGPMRIAALAKEHGKPAALLVGAIAAKADTSAFVHAAEASPGERPASEDAARLLRVVAQEMVGRVRRSKE